MTAIAIGTDLQSNGKLVLDKKARETHVHVIGASGTGKSYFLEQMIRRDISRGSGVCFIDPHGETYNNLVAWLATSGISARSVHLINPSRGEFSVGFNPLCLEDSNPSRRVLDMLHAFMRVWGGTDMDQTPRLKKCLRNTLYALAVHRLSLLEASLFTSTRYRSKRQELTANLPIWEYSDEWAEFDTYTPKEYREYFESTRSRIFEFITSPAIRPIIGQTENVLDFRACMEQGHIVLVNLAESPDFHKQEAHLLGAMLIADMYAAAKQRDVAAASRQPFYAYIDECADYLNEDIAKSLDETRKYGLHFTLSHQRLGQLRALGDNVYDAVMSNAQTKVVFRVDDDDNAEQLCRALLRSEFDLEVPKEILNKPAAVGQEIIELFSESTSYGEAHGRSDFSSEGQGESAGMSAFIPEEGENRGHTEISGLSSMSGSGSGTSSITSEVKTFGSSQSLRTVYEEMPTAVYSLDEIIHMGIRSIREMPKRQALVRPVGGRPARVYTLDISNRRPLALQMNNYVRRVSTRSPYAVPTVQALAAIDDRQVSWFGPRGPIHEEPLEDDEDMFRVRE